MQRGSVPFDGGAKPADHVRLRCVLGKRAALKRMRMAVQDYRDPSLARSASARLRYGQEVWAIEPAAVAFVQICPVMTKALSGIARSIEPERI